MELIALGTSGAYPAAGGAASGYLVRHDGFNLWMDAGTGTLSNLQLHIAHSDIDAILISHEHIDHCIDLYPLFIARFFHPEPLPPLPVVAPPGVFERVAALEDADGREQMRGTFEVRELVPGDGTEIGPFAVTSRLLPHWVPNAGMRLQADGVVLAYTGDTGPSEDIETIGRNADLLVTEASWQDSDRERQPYHLTARTAAEHAARAGSKRLMLSHFWPGLDRDVSREQAGEEYDGDIVLAHEGLTVEVGA